jgi:hypothetical protein
MVFFPFIVECGKKLFYTDIESYKLLVLEDAVVQLLLFLCT